MAGSVDGTVRCFDLRAGACYADELGHPVASMALSHDGNCLLAACLDSRVRLLDREGGELLAMYQGDTVVVVVLVLVLVLVLVVLMMTMMMMMMMTMMMMLSSSPPSCPLPLSPPSCPQPSQDCIFCQADTVKSSPDCCKDLEELHAL